MNRLDIIPPGRLRLLERAMRDCAAFDRAYGAVTRCEESACSAWRRFGRRPALLESAGHPMEARRRTWERLTAECRSAHPGDWARRRREDGLPRAESFGEMLERKTK